jgi:hypothetical protein
VDDHDQLQHSDVLEESHCRITADTPDKDEVLARRSSNGKMSVSPSIPATIFDISVLLPVGFRMYV